MTKEDLKARAWEILAQFRKKVLETIDAFPPDVWDERHVYIARQIIQAGPELSIEQIIEKIKIKDAALTCTNWHVNKDQGPVELTQHERNLNKEVENEN